MRVLVVEDEARVAGFIRRGLKEEHFAVDVAADGEQALTAVNDNEYDLVILDLVIPKQNGMEVLRHMRSEGITTPVLILTAKDDLRDKVKGLNAGADDYLTKPFGFEELLARIRALLRRQSGTSVAGVLKVADLELDGERHRAARKGKEIPLTPREYRVLEYLLRHAGRVVTRTMLAEHVWEQDFDPQSNVIDVVVARLRGKIDNGFTPKLLHTIRGSGYTLKA